MVLEEFNENIWVQTEMSDFWLMTFVSWQIWAQFEDIIVLFWSIRLLKSIAKEKMLNVKMSKSRSYSTYYRERLFVIVW